MAKQPIRRSFRPRVESLEPRETPSATSISQSFDATAPGALPGGWSKYSNGGTVGVSTLHAAGGSHGLTIAQSATQTGRAWLNATLPADVQAGAAVYVASTTPGQVLVRGHNLGGGSPDYYAVAVERGLYVQLLRVVNGATTVLGTLTSQSYVSNQWINVTLSVSGNSLGVQIYQPGSRHYLNNSGQWQSTPTWVLLRSDYAIPGAGAAGVARPAGTNGSASFDNFTVSYQTTSPPPPPPPSSGPPQSSRPPGGSGPAIPQHYSHIRIAELAYSGMPFGYFEDQLLRSSVDLVVADVGALGAHIHAVNPGTPQLAYSNVSNLYLGELTDWLNYADTHGLSREAAFYHVTQATPFQGNSSSSQPVNWFWGVYEGGSTADFTDLTTAAHSSDSRSVPFGGQGTSLYVGYPEKFREMNFNLALGAHDGWSAVLEYPTAVDADGNPTAWAPLRTLSDTTLGLAHSGKIVFDPPANWKTSLAGGTARLYYVRFRTYNDGTAPVANTILGRDYVNAYGSTHGVIPAFDYAADKDHDGYLSDAEYAHRARGKDARFVYESRAFYGYYGQERFATNPSDAGYRTWAVDFSLRYLNSHPYSAGLFMDNSGANPFFSSDQVLEPVSFYSHDYGTLLAAIDKGIGSRWVLANTSGGSTTADGVVQQGGAYFEEFGLRPLAHSWQQFEDLAATIAHRSGLRAPAPLAVLDALPAGGSPTDPRTQLATLAEYYMFADPQKTFLDPFGGYEPGTTWARHWFNALAYNVGQPQGEWSLYATGSDPSRWSLTYRVYQRQYGNALVLYKPLSYAQGASAAGSLGAGSATTHSLGGLYRPLRADGTLGSPVSRVTLRNGEGAILIKA